MERDRYREYGKITSVFDGKEDHGIQTVTVTIDFNGSCQGFGSIQFDTQVHRKSFVGDLCAAFGVEKLVDLVGLNCFALRCFDTWNTQIEGLESAGTGRRFVLTTWRRKFWPDALDPLAHHLDVCEREVESRVRHALRLSSDAARLAMRYREVK